MVSRNIVVVKYSLEVQCKIYLFSCFKQWCRHPNHSMKGAFARISDCMVIQYILCHHRTSSPWGMWVVGSCILGWVWRRVVSWPQFLSSWGVRSYRWTLHIIGSPEWQSRYVFFCFVVLWGTLPKEMHDMVHDPFCTAEEEILMLLQEKILQNILEYSFGEFLG